MELFFEVISTFFLSFFLFAATIGLRCFLQVWKLLFPSRYFSPVLVYVRVAPVCLPLRPFFLGICYQLTVWSRVGCQCYQQWPRRLRSSWLVQLCQLAVSAREWACALMGKPLGCTYLRITFLAENRPLSWRQLRTIRVCVDRSFAGVTESPLLSWLAVLLRF